MDDKKIKLILNGVTVLAGVILVISCFVDYVSALGGMVSVALIDAQDGYIVMALAAGTIIAAFIEREREQLSLALATLIYTIYEMMDAGDLGSVIDHELGYYLLILGSVVIFLAALGKVIYKKKFSKEA